MSKIGVRPIKIEDGVNVEITSKKFTASFGETKLSVPLPETIVVKQEDNIIRVTRKNDEKQSKSYHGLIARLIGNAIAGVKNGFVRELTYTGTGYKIAVDNGFVILNMGYSHEVKLEIPKDLTVEIKKGHVFVKGADKFEVGQFASLIRSVRGPEVYKGKGIKYIDEFIKRKAGKKASS